MTEVLLPPRLKQVDEGAERVGTQRQGQRSLPQVMRLKAVKLRGGRDFKARNPKILSLQRLLQRGSEVDLNLWRSF
ncbi:hypothetical protein E7T06_11215 [Deinococcus sp. Arct2-2]|uniref:hypothetical protein n=1 Tax=Deinococcus sp. Arct2-2 TaxID=2568653 RepID=UPI0010A50B5A|nr:hypothetical protein [Deinococcus sp. Arct2-2]THF69581.1 hypothetical protein E7T06_11215 [Deinococcus sp. Arct2-2]